jgi:hypothetical protein
MAHGFEHNKQHMHHADTFLSIDTVRLLIEGGADITAKDQQGTFFSYSPKYVS